MNKEVWVCGLGAISSIGLNAEDNFRSLSQGHSGVSYPEFLHTIHKQDLPVCEIKQTNESLAALSGMKIDLPRTVYLSAIAATEALQHSGLSAHDETLRFGFISGNTLGGMDTTEFFYNEFLQDVRQGRLKDVVHHECGSVTDLVAKHIGIRHFVTTLSTACSSSANAILHGSRMIRHGLLDVVIAGGADALCRFTLNGFNTLMILDSEPCKPFDENRKGLNLGEGAGYVVLVSDAVRQKYQLTALAKVSGYANANDAFHQTASSPEGKGNYMAMEQALHMSGLRTEDINYINAHGTGTANNDSSEGLAIDRLFGDHVPLVSSTKGHTGHTLGACGGLEAVYCCFSLMHDAVYPNLRHQNKIQEHSFSPVRVFSRDHPIHHVMSNSFGFGGNCTSLIFSKANH
ncbi:MAG: beta-ketoacyl-[acyl-carrier-protein] synthase family protein [Chitinophagaceae bacterium]|nr:beta-ketoacyl-[acyl-carrier-protein] synthase family protein [Chitinophagaceae bacterium]